MKSKFIHIILAVFFSLHWYLHDARCHINPYNFFKTLTIEDGLSNNKVNCIAKDSTGFIWFGTNEGLNRYDGFDFKVYRHDNDNPKSLSHDLIRDLMVTHDGELIITTDRGAHIYNDKYENFHQIPFLIDKNEISGIVWSVTSDSKGNLWFGSTKGLFVKYKDVKDAILFETKNFRSDSLYVLEVFIDSNDNIILGTLEKGMFYIDHQSDSVLNFRNDINNSRSISQNRIESIYEDREGNIYVGTYDKGVDKFNPATGSFNKQSLQYLENNNTRVRSINQDYNNNLWLGTYNGLYVKFPEDSVFTRMGHSTNVYMHLLNNSIYDIFIDDQKVLWLGTYSGGVNYMDLDAKHVRFFGVKDNDNRYLNGRDVQTIVEGDENTLWIGTGAGINKFDRKSNLYTYYTSDNSNLKSDNIKALLVDKNNNGLWIGSYKGGLCYLDFISNRIMPLTELIPDKTLINSSVYSLCYDHDGNMWIGYDNGVAKIPENNDKIVYYPPYEHSSVLFTYDVFVDHENNIWVGSSAEGLYNLNKRTDEFERISIKDAYIEGGIYNMCEDVNGCLWLASTHGLYFVDHHNSRVLNYRDDDGLPSNTVFKVSDDANGNLWITTSLGLVKFNNGVEKPDSANFSVFNTNEPLNIKQFVFNSHTNNRNGPMYFGGVNGFISFYPGELTINKNVPKTHITDLYLFGKKVHVDDYIEGKKVLDKPIYKCNTLHLSYKHNVFSFSFTALNYASSRKNKYAYKLSGFDKQWTYVDAENTRATYTNLPGGEYTFLVKAANLDGIWDENPTALKIKIQPPYWETWWFRIIVLLILTGSIIWIIRFRTRKLKDQSMELENLVQLRTEELEKANKKLTSMNKSLSQQKKELERAFKESQELQEQLIESEKMASIGVLASGVAHEVNNPLNFIQAGISGLEEYFNDHLKKHYHHVAPLINSINIGIERATNIVKSLNHFNRQSRLAFEKCGLHDIIDNCLTILESLHRDRISIEKEYMKEHDTIIGNEGELHQALLNILKNAIQAIPDKGYVKIKTWQNENKLMISVYDSGVGIPQKNLAKISEPFFTTKDPGQGTGLGLSITYSIIKKHKGTIKFNSETNKGTEVLITLPKNN